MSTFEHRDGFRYWTPLPTLLGKLGEKGGPTFEDYLFARQARDSFPQSGVLLNESPLVEPPHVPPSPLRSDGKPVLTTGPQPPLAPPREEAPRLSQPTSTAASTGTTIFRFDDAV